MIPVARILKEFQRMADENWTYVWGGAKEGKVDCSGAFCYVYNLEGLKIDHGSNSIARKFVGELLPISEAKPGMAAFKRKKWTESETDKNNRWYGTEPGNISHIGLVGQNGDTVLHASGVNSGFIESELNDSWAFVAYLNDVDYDSASVSIFGNATVTTKRTELNIRALPDAGSMKIGEVDKGTRIMVTGVQNDWYEVTLKNGTTGYASKDYITLDAMVDPNDMIGTPTEETIHTTNTTRVVIEDEEGNVFYPVGAFQVRLVADID